MPSEPIPERPAAKDQWLCDVTHPGEPCPADRPAANLHEQAEQRVYTNDLDALEALIVEGLPPDEMQAAAWVLVQRVRGLRADLARVEKARAAWRQEARIANARP